MKRHAHHLVATAAMALFCASLAQAADEPNPAEDIAKRAGDALGLEFSGYARTGYYGADGNARVGGLHLDGDLQKYRLGNEGDNYIEFAITKKFDLGEGLKWGVTYMPSVTDGVVGTEQLYGDITGLDFAPEASFWVGQRYHQVAGVHIVDHWLMQDGGNYGGGVDGLRIGKAKLNLALYGDSSTYNKGVSTNNASRLNAQLLDIETNPGGSLNLTAALLSGNFGLGHPGGAIGVMHKQKDFLLPGVTNSFFVQAAEGHATTGGRFYNLDEAGVAQPGARHTRIADAIEWQHGAFGGQALVGYETKAPDNGPMLRDSSLGGRVSYGVSRHLKLLGEGAVTLRESDGLATQRLYKATAALALAPNVDFWSRPEFRLYVTRANWNDAAAQAHASSYGAKGRTDATTFGMQMEVWW